MSTQPVTSEFWQEQAQADNPFAAALCRCAGFDVYGDLLGKITATDYLYLLVQREPPQDWQRQMLNALAVALGNPGPRDLSVQAALSAGAGGSGLAACLMAALAPAAGNLGGAQEVNGLMKLWQSLGIELSRWQDFLRQDFPLIDPNQLFAEVWPSVEHPPGFDPYGNSCTAPVLQSLATLAGLSRGACLPWLLTQRPALEAAAGRPLALCGVAAAAFTDLGLTPQAAEMLFLLLRLPGAAAHALEQHERGWRDYPFHGNSLVLTNDPGAIAPQEKNGD